MLFLDTTPASITAGSVTTTSSNTRNDLAKAGDTITISFSSSEALDTTSSYVTINQNVQQLLFTNTGGTTYAATYKVQATDAQGPITVSFYLVDIVGNSATVGTQPATPVTIGTYLH